MRFTSLTSIVSLVVLTAAVPHHVERRTGIPIPITKRSGFVKADGSADFEALNAHLALTEAKILRGFENFEKNTGASHPSALKGVQKRATGADPLTNVGTSLWYGTIFVGTPANNFTVDFDTGSSDLFLPGPQCTANCNGHTIYNPSASSTSQDLGQAFVLTYGEGSVSCEEYTDTVSVAGLEATGQALGVATSYSSNFAVEEFPPDGVMGMAFPSISAFSANPVFQNLISQGQTSSPVFSFKLSTGGSELYLGGANSALYTGKFTYTPVTQEGYWQVNMGSIDVNGQTVVSNVDSIIDTGTTLIILPSSQATSFYNTIGGTDIGGGYYTFPCSAFPSVSLTFGGTSWPISAATLNIGTVSAGSSDCVSGIMGSTEISCECYTNTAPIRFACCSIWVIGDVFLQNVYTTFDVGNTQVGFAQLA